MKKILTISLLFVVCASSIGCSNLRFPGVYRLRVAQGNYIEQKMVDQLEVGMTKRQVRFVMGTPLVKDTFNVDRWDYYFTVRHGDKELKEHHFTVFFEQDSLTRWEGNYERQQITKKETMQEALEDTEKEDQAKFKKNDDKEF